MQSRLFDILNQYYQGYANVLFLTTGIPFSQEAKTGKASEYLASLVSLNAKQLCKKVLADIQNQENENKLQFDVNFRMTLAYALCAYSKIPAKNILQATHHSEKKEKTNALKALCELLTHKLLNETEAMESNIKSV